MDLEDELEVGIAVYLSTNILNGVRAKAQWLLDWLDVDLKAGSGNERPGLELTYLADKDDREQRGRVKPVFCSSVCNGKFARTPAGELDVARFCPAHFMMYYKELLAKQVGVEAAKLIGPVFARYLKIREMLSGSTLFACEGESRSKEAPEQVMVLSRAEEESRLYYTGVSGGGLAKVAAPRNF